MSNACIWGHKEYKEVLRIQYNAMRFLLGVGKACPIVGLFGHLDIVLPVVCPFVMLYYALMTSVPTTQQCIILTIYTSSSGAD